MNAVVIVIILVIAFAASLFTMAFLTARMRRTRRSLNAADYTAARGLYDRYVADVEVLTREYLLHAPADDVWLSKVRDRSEAPARRHRQCSPPQHVRGLAWDPCRLRLPLEIPLTALAVGVTFSVLAHSLLDPGLVGWWLAAVTVAIGTVLGKLIGFRDPGETGQGRRSRENPGGTALPAGHSGFG